MITLKTLPYATEQEVFEQVAMHLLEQNQKSLDGHCECAYRGDAGLKCAAGCLIADDEYRVSFESENWASLVDAGHVPKKHKMLITRLQNIHDVITPTHWERFLKMLAKNLGLAWAKVATEARREF